MEILIDSLVNDAINMGDAIEALRHDYACHDESDRCPTRTLIRLDEKSYVRRDALLLQP